MRETRSSGSVEGVMSNRDPYSDSGPSSLLIRSRGSGLSRLAGSQLPTLTSNEGQQIDKAVLFWKIFVECWQSGVGRKASMILGQCGIGQPDALRKTLIRLGLYVKYIRSYFVQERLQMSSGRFEDRPWWTGLPRATPVTFSLSRMLGFMSAAVIPGVCDEKGSATPLR
jgi:hypothetical protein